MKILLLTMVMLAGCATREVPPLVGAVVHNSAFGAGVGGYLRGVVGENSADDGGALAGYLEALAEDPTNVNVQLRSMQLALLRGDVDTAGRLVKTLPAEAAGQVMPLLVKMTTQLQAGKTDDARRTLRTLVARTPTLLQSAAMLAYLRAVAGGEVVGLVKELESLKLPEAMAGRRDYYVAQLWRMGSAEKKALVALEKAHAADPGMVWAARALADAYARAGKGEQAAKMAKEFKGLNPLTENLAGAMAENLGALPMTPKAVAGDLNTRVGEVLIDFSLLAWAQGATVPARQMMALVQVLMPNDAYAAYYAGMVEEFGGDLGRARVLYGVAQADPEVALAAKVRLAEVAFKNGDVRAGKRLLAGLVDDHGGVAMIRLMAAERAMALQDYDDAVGHYEQLLKLLPATLPKEALATVYFSTGAAYERAGKYVKAEEYLRQSLALQPANAQVLNYLGYMWVEQGKNVDAALVMLRKALAMAPQDGAIVDSVGWAYFVKGDYPRALIYLERAAEMEPDDATVAEHLGDVYAKLGRAADAKRLWQQALELNAAAEHKDEKLGRRVEKKLAR